MDNGHWTMVKTGLVQFWVHVMKLSVIWLASPVERSQNARRPDLIAVLPLSLAWRLERVRLV